MRVIGLTGGIGTGKTVVSQILRELGAEVIEADRVGHEAYQPGTEAWQAVVREFGQDVLQPSGEIDRKRLGAVVFGDPKALELLNAIMHPRIYRMVEERLAKLRVQGVRAAVVEAAILIEAGWTPLVDEVWVVTAEEEEVIRRLQGRTALSEEQVRSRMRSQMSSAERVAHADVVIENKRDLADLRDQIESVWRSRINGRA